MKVLTAVAALAISVLSFTSAHAIETQNCPENIAVSIAKVEPFKTSIYSKTPGWEAARNALRNYAGGEYKFELASRGPKSCRYTDVNGAKAILMSIASYDPEDGRTYNNEQLLVEFSVDGTELTMFPGVVDYSVSDIKISAGRSKVRTKLVNPKGQPWNYEVGHADIRSL